MKTFKYIHFFSMLILTSFLVLSCNNTDKNEKKLNNKADKDTCIGKVSMHIKKHKLIFNHLQEKPDTILIFKSNKYQIIPEKSQLEWFCDKHTGTVLLQEGYFQAKNGKLIAGAFIVNMDSIHDTDIDNNLMRGTLENILKSEDFFDIKNYPQSIFIITEIKNEKGNIFSIKGKLKIKEMEKPIAFKSLFDFSGDTLLAKSDKFVIDRT
ncbi:MAG: YceI family protein, partial [Bacteroidales bacterium]|nr:YceI family protein [Bacteroidales bacterium]